MTDAFFRAVADTLFPGDAVCPSATAAGLDAADHVADHAAILDALAERAGGRAAFVDAEAAHRIAIVREIERAHPAAFRALTTALAGAFYGLPAVLAAFDWPERPPQPEGFPLIDPGAAIAPLLDKVRRRGAIWRKAATSK
jgi:hypothetical protein